jgi:sterol desaturase/sphingolipid hydroxylase (fatty acid hydroxylase superfamily)
MNLDPQLFPQFFYYVAFNITKAVTAFIQRGSFLYWPFLVSAGVLALAVACFAVRARAPEEGRSWWQALRESLSLRNWWHRSARADYRLYFVNALTLPLLFGVLAFGDRQVVSLLDGTFGLTPAVDGLVTEPPSIAARIAFTVVFFIAYDFGRFVAHSVLHDVPVLWEFHKVHHSAETLNPITTFRAHPVDLLVMLWVPALMTGAVTWGFNRLTVAPVGVYTYLGLHVLLFASNLIGTLRHTHVWLSYGTFWGKWLVSPAQHQLHHSCEQRHVGCNRGFEIALWDRLYGTLYVPARKETFRMGLGDGTDGEWHTVRRMYFWPFVNAGKRIFGAGRREPVGPPPSRPSP